jgi:hypothetical protein
VDMYQEATQTAPPLRSLPHYPVMVRQTHFEGNSSSLSPVYTQGGLQHELGHPPYSMVRLYSALLHSFAEGDNAPRTILADKKSGWIT